MEVCLSSAVAAQEPMISIPSSDHTTCCMFAHDSA
jgi:hypothetical protein